MPLRSCFLLIRTWASRVNARTPGLSLTPSIGAITGTPNTPGTYPFTAQVTDNNGLTSSMSCSITIGAAAQLTVVSVTCSLLPTG